MHMRAALSRAIPRRLGTRTRTYRVRRPEHDEVYVPRVPTSNRGLNNLPKTSKTRSTRFRFTRKLGKGRNQGVQSLNSVRGPAVYRVSERFIARNTGLGWEHRSIYQPNKWWALSDMSHIAEIEQGKEVSATEMHAAWRERYELANAPPSKPSRGYTFPELADSGLPPLVVTHDHVAPAELNEVMHLQESLGLPVTGLNAWKPEAKSAPQEPELKPWDLQSGQSKHMSDEELEEWAIALETEEDMYAAMDEQADLERKQRMVDIDGRSVDPQELLEKHGWSQPDLSEFYPELADRFAVVNINKKQYKVCADDTVMVDRQDHWDIGQRVTFDEVLLCGSKDWTVVGRPVIPGSTVECVVEEHDVCSKVVIFKKKRRKRYRTKKGFRHRVTVLRVLSVNCDYIQYGDGSEDLVALGQSERDARIAARIAEQPSFLRVDRPPVVKGTKQRKAVRAPRHLQGRDTKLPRNPSKGYGRRLI